MKMKKIIALLLPVVVAFAAAMPCNADTETVGGYTWTYRITGGTAEIFNDNSVAISPNPTGAVTIPSTLGGKPVTSIGRSAFSDCSGLTSVSIPNSVTSIGILAFNNCSGLRSVTIPDSVMSIKDYAFFGCSGLSIVTIPDSVTNIGTCAFGLCSSLGNVTIPAGVVHIGMMAFDGTALWNAYPDGNI